MSDPLTTGEPTDAAAPLATEPAGAAPQRHSAIDQTKDAARRILATITGRSKS